MFVASPLPHPRISLEDTIPPMMPVQKMSYAALRLPTQKNIAMTGNFFDGFCCDCSPKFLSYLMLSMASTIVNWDARVSAWIVNILLMCYRQTCMKLMFFPRTIVVYGKSYVEAAEAALGV